MSGVKISQAGVADVSVISKIQKKSWLAAYPKLGVGVSRDDILTRDFRKREIGRRHNMANKNWRYWLAKKDNRPIGYLAVKKEGNKGVIKLIHVLPEFQNKGVGSVLFKQALKWLEGKKVILQVAKANFGAIEFYKKFGFSFIGQGQPIRVAGKEIDTARMVKITNPRGRCVSPRNLNT